MNHSDWIPAFSGATILVAVFYLVRHVIVTIRRRLPIESAQPSDTVPGQPFSLANLVDTGTALYGHGWQTAMARELHVPAQSITAWCDGRAIPDLRKQLADLCRRHDPYDPNMERMARKLEALSPPPRSSFATM
jgi:hypothetical protein